MAFNAQSRAKGQYAFMLARDNLTRSMTAEFLDQADREVSANDFRNAQTGINTPVEWHFREKEVADFAWALFGEARLLPRIRVCYTPFGTGTSDCYPSRKQ
jgi:hypothetical protein